MLILAYGWSSSLGKEDADSETLGRRQPRKTEVVVELGQQYDSANVLVGCDVMHVLGRRLAI